MFKNVVMKTLVLPIFFIFFVTPASSDDGRYFNATDGVPQRYYPWITFLSGENYVEINNSDDERLVAYIYRVVITTSEIYNDLIIEKLSIGSEGCCKKIIWARSIDTYKFAKEFGIIGEFSGLRFAGWEGDYSFDFTIHGRTFRASEIDNPKIRIKEVIKSKVGR